MGWPCAKALLAAFRKYKGSAGVAHWFFSAAARKLFHRPMILPGRQGVSHCSPVTGTPTPTIGAIYAATRLLAHTLAAQHGRLRVEPA